MRTFDFAPFYRSTVGFDRLFSMLDQVGGVEGAAAPGYPPYNIKRSGENAYNISVAVAGFADADLSIEVKENTLTIRGNKQSSGDEESDNLIYQVSNRHESCLAPIQDSSCRSSPSGTSRPIATGGPSPSANTG
jgi:molecular chaperone IbpA